MFTQLTQIGVAILAALTIEHDVKHELPMPPVLGVFLLLMDLLWAYFRPL